MYSLGLGSAKVQNDAPPSSAEPGAEVAAWGLQTQVFEMTWAPTPLMWWLGPLAGAVIVGALGVWSCRRVVSVPPIVLLREV